VNITLSLRIVSFNDVDEELRGVMSNRTTFPVVGFYTTANLSRVRAIQQQFDMYGNCYMFKESLIPHIYVQYMRDLYVRYRDVIIPVYNVPRVLVVVETLRPPKVRVNETPVMSFLDAKYYLVIYEGVYRLACANFYTRELPIIGIVVNYIRLLKKSLYSNLADNTSSLIFSINLLSFSAISGYFIPSILSASSAAFFALPIATVATGTP
jgi:hypothetical protein